MELVKSAGKRTSRLSEALYVLFNVGLAAAVFALVFFEVPVLAYLLVALSKWRVFAVRPRFWWANIKANLLDLLLGLSMVAMMLQSSELVWLQAAVAILYALWLVILKPRSEQSAILVQAGVAQFMAITALFSVSYDWPSWVVVACMWVIGYISAQHALSTFEDSDVTLFSFIWGLIVAELGWLGYTWAIAFTLVPTSSLKIPSIALIVTLLAYLSSRAYKVYSSKNKLRLNDVTFPAIFSSGIILIILIFFNDINRG